MRGSRAGRQVHLLVRASEQAQCLGLLALGGGGGVRDEPLEHGLGGRQAPVVDERLGVLAANRRVVGAGSQERIRHLLDRGEVAAAAQRSEDRARGDRGIRVVLALDVVDQLGAQLGHPAGVELRDRVDQLAL